ncbi:MAG TPA: glycoside hydrolase domain-containing protein [Planctomycetota bacterium]|nr:glycoside hydrolase domain-containing protein [Planctomycetota bacterium]
MTTGVRKRPSQHPRRPAAWRLLWALAACAAWCAAAATDDAPAPVPVLDTASFWRYHYHFRMPVVRTAGGIRPIPLPVHADAWRKAGLEQKMTWMEHDTPLPSADWASPDFDDSAWARFPGVIVAGLSENADRKSPYLALVCLRGKFQVTDPARAGGMTLSVSYRGGAVVYLNGVEIARGHLPKLNREARVGKPPVAHAFHTLAEDYRKDEPRTRTLADVPVPARLLRRGTNVLAVEIHRAPFAETDEFKVATDWTRTFYMGPATCGIERIRLSSPPAAASAVTPNVARPPGLQVWNSDLVAADFDLDYGDPSEPLRPIRIVGTPGGVFSGKVVVGSTEAIKGLRGEVSALAAVKGGGRIPASALTVRYALPGIVTPVGLSWVVMPPGPAGHEVGADSRYLAAVTRFDALAEVPPEEIPVRVRQPHTVRGRLLNLDSPGIPLVFGAVVPVWVTAHVPADAPAGDYRGTLTLRMTGAAPVTLPVELTLSDWPLPHPHRFRTFVEIVQSPESVALQYDVPLWSDAHFTLMEKSLKLLGDVGNKTVYIPLVTETNLGNAESMVRWIKRPDGSYTHDFRIMERYLDLVEKCQGKPLVVCFHVWDPFLGHVGRRDETLWTGQTARDARRAYMGRGVKVSVLDPATGKVEDLELPPYRDPKSKTLWKPLLEEVRRRMKRRGLEDVMMLGLPCDWIPDKETVTHFAELLPGVPWTCHAHGYRRDLHGVPVGFRAHVYSQGGDDVVDPTVRRLHGWRLTELKARFPRDIRDSFHLTLWRVMGEVNIASNFRGVARRGGDFWPVLKDSRGRKVGTLAGRYPKSTWGTIDVATCLLSPGREGAIATARFEMLREGLQECEARIFIEQALTDDGLREKLGRDLVARSQLILDERTRSVLRGLSSFMQSGGATHHAAYTGGRRAPAGMIGHQWFVGSGWQQRSQDLYAAAADVAGVIGHQD